MENFTPITGLVGGLMIGLASWGLLVLNGKIAGISGIFGGLLKPANAHDAAWRALFLIGLVGGVAAYRFLYAPESTITFSGGNGWPILVAGGVLVGFGTRLGGGCTSGHGVCGIGRFSMRSITATVIFMATAAITVFVVRHLIGG
jgi:uncharacterized membrane protein YedE/YeeE